MSLTVHRDLMQGSDEWLAARLGIVTASVVGELLTATLRVADNAGSRGLLDTLVAERVTGRVDSAFVSGDMWRGMRDEPHARAAYAAHHAPVAEVGLMVRDFGAFRLGYSPDGLVDEDGLIEIKSRAPKHHLRTILAGEVPREHLPQIQCGLLVSGRKWCDYISFCGGMPLWAKRVRADLMWHAAITQAAATFEERASDALTLYEAATAGLPATERLPDYDEIEV